MSLFGVGYGYKTRRIAIPGSFAGEEGLEVAEEGEGLQGGEVVGVDVDYLVAHLREQGVVELKERQLVAVALPTYILHADLADRRRDGLFLL